MPLNIEIIERFDAAEMVLIPKGENREPVIALLEDSGLEVPEFGGRCLHCRR
jgi:hypothetical protein